MKHNNLLRLFLLLVFFKTGLAIHAQERNLYEQPPEERKIQLQKGEVIPFHTKREDLGVVKGIDMVENQESFQESTLFFEDFEKGASSWTPNNSWEIGIPL
ncbi:MAG TPA: hypothetical protein ACFCUD_11165, partial [Cyclobacteriaceae bacterium]